MRQALSSAGFVVAVCLLTTGAGAGTLEPGQSKSGNSVEPDVFPLPEASQWQGELLAERTENWELNGREPHPGDGGERPFARGTFTSRVFRDLATGGLAFFHVLRQDEELGINDLERVILRGLGTTPIDLYSERDEFNVNRSADGDRVVFQFNRETINGSFLVRTPDTAFGLYRGAFGVEMDFEPSAGNDGADFIAYAPVPEPSAAALAVLGGALLMRRRGTARRAGTVGAG